jgi:transposase
VQDFRVWRRVLGIEGRAVIERVVSDPDTGDVVVWCRPFRAALPRCGRCGRVAVGYDRGEGRRRWRALDAGPLRVFIEADAPRVDCPEHGATVVAVPWARHRARHTYGFEDTVAWLVRHCAKSVVAVLLRVAWETVGAIIERVMASVDDRIGDRLAGVRRIGIDEVSYQKGHKYLVVVVDHATGRLLWVGDGRTKKTLAGFFDLLGEDGCARVALVSADGADWIADMVGLRCPNARLCMDPYHVVSWATKALDLVRRRVVNTTRRQQGATAAASIKDSRWALLKNPANLTERQRLKLAEIQKTNLHLYRAYLLKEQLRQVFAAGGEERIELLDAWLTWAARCQIPEFVELARKMRRYRDDIAHTLVHRLTNGPVEGLNARVRLIINIARGFRSVHALMATLRLHLGDYRPTLPGRDPALT